jgi:hypothetical protein
MKNIFYSLLVVLLGLSFTSCEDEFVPEVTEAADFAGEWFYQIQNEDGDLYADYMYHDPTFMTYNSAENLPNEVWFDDQGVYLAFKSKFDLSGDNENFSSGGLAINQYEYHTPDSVPESDGVNLDIDIDYGAVDLRNGKILKGAATVNQDHENAPADSIYFETVFYTATYSFTSVEQDGEFSWQLNDPPFTIDETTEEVYVVSGHRKTGWEVYID